MITKNYEYNGIVYKTEQAVRQAIFKKERKAFGTPKSVEEWKELGVSYSEIEEVVDLVEPSSLKLQKIQKLESMFETFLNSKNNYFKSSLGIVVNGNLRSQSLLNGLALQAEDGEVEFRDYDNKIVSLSYEQINVLRKELSKHLSNLYAQKWSLTKQLEDCIDDELGNVVIKFEPSEF